MLRFCGFDLELTIQGAIDRRADGPAAYRATDATGEHWLIVEAPGQGPDLCWMCAPASELAADLVASGRAAVSDALHHSRTGWVEIVRVVDGHAVPDERVSCAEVAARAGALRGPAGP